MLNLVLCEGVCPNNSIFGIIVRFISFYTYIWQIVLWSAGASHFSCHYDRSAAEIYTWTIKFALRLKFECELKSGVYFA